MISARLLHRGWTSTIAPDLIGPQAHLPLALCPTAYKRGWRKVLLLQHDFSSSDRRVIRRATSSPVGPTSFVIVSLHFSGAHADRRLFAPL